MHAGPVLDPVEIQQLAGEVLCRIAGDLQLLVGYEISVGAPCSAAGTKRLGLNRRMIGGRIGAGMREKVANAIGEPKSSEEVLHRVGERPGEIALGIHQRNAGGKTIVAPRLDDALDELRFTVE